MQETKYAGMQIHETDDSESDILDVDINDIETNYFKPNDSLKTPGYLPIQQFSLNEMGENPSILIIGKRGSGKSWVIKDILKTIAMKNKPVTIISPGEKYNPWYRTLPDLNIRTLTYEYESKIIEDVFLYSEGNDKKSHNAPETKIFTGSNMRQYLLSLQKMTSTALLKHGIEFDDIEAMRQLFDQMVEERINQTIREESERIQESLGTLSENQNPGLCDLNEIKDKIDRLIYLKQNKFPDPTFKVPCYREDPVTVESDNSDDLISYLECDPDNHSYQRMDEQSIRESKNIEPLNQIIVLDDCLASKGKWSKDPLIQDLLLNAKHRKISYVLTMQYPLGISPEIRSNFDYVFLLAEDFQSNLKRIYEHYGGMFPNFNSFRQVFNQLTEDFGCMVIRNRGCRKNIFDKIAWFRAS